MGSIQRICAIAAATLLVAAAGSAARAAVPVGEVAEMIGVAQVRTGSNQAWIPLRFGDPVHAGDLVTTQPGSKLKIIFQDQTVMTIGPKTRMRIDESVYTPPPRAERKSLFSLFEGKVRSLVSNFFADDDENRFEIRTPSAVAGVRGTEYITSVDADGSTDVLVLDGVVEVYNRRDKQRRAVFLGEGMGSKIDPSKTPSEPRELSQEELDRARDDTDISAEDSLISDTSGDSAQGDGFDDPQDAGEGDGPADGGSEGDGDEEQESGGDDDGESGDDAPPAEGDETGFNDDGAFGDEGFGDGDLFEDVDSGLDDNVTTGRLPSQDVQQNTRVRIEVDFR